MVAVAAFVVGGCGGAPLPVDAPAGTGRSSVGGGNAPSKDGAGGNGGAASPAPSGGSAPSPAPGGGSATGATTTYDVPSGGVLACGAAPTTHPVVEPAATTASTTRSDGRCIDGAYTQNGVCTCSSWTPTACDGACVNTMRDAANCGACGRGCGPTSTCIAGACGPPVTNVVPPAPGCGSLNLATNGRALFWTDQGHGTVRSQPLDGCEATTIVSGEASPTLLTADGATLAWVTSSSTKAAGSNVYDATTTTATLRALALPGGAPRDLVTETNTTGGIVGLVLSADGRTLYYSAGPRVRAVPVAGGAAFDVGHEEAGIPTALARDGDMIAYVAALDDNDIDTITVKDGVVASCGRADAAGNVPMTNCVRSRGCNPEAFLGGLVLHDQRVYWIDGMNVEGFPLTAATPASKDIIATGDSQGGAPSGFAGGPDYIYFAAGDASDAVINRTAYASGSTAVSIARGQRVPSSLVVAGSALYWATADCAINSVPR
jgi:hypothetical protein